jgi:hypothetical protein
MRLRLPSQMLISGLRGPRSTLFCSWNPGKAAVSVVEPTYSEPPGVAPAGLPSSFSSASRRSRSVLKLKPEDPRYRRSGPGSAAAHQRDHRGIATEPEQVANRRLFRLERSTHHGPVSDQATQHHRLGGGEQFVRQCTRIDAGDLADLVSVPQHSACWRAR